MDIKEFVESAIIQVVEGVNNASLRIIDSGVRIGSQPSMGSGNIIINTDRELMNSLDFDIAVVAVEKDSTSGGGGIKIAGISLGGSASNENTNHSISRIQFSVPIQFKLSHSND